jgi:hypothetical protein
MKQVEIGIKGRPFTMALDVPEGTDAQSIITTVKAALLSGEVIQTEAGPLYLNPARSSGELYDYIFIPEPKEINITVAPPQEVADKFTPGVPFIHTFRAGYLGHKLKIDAAILDVDYESYYLVLRINDKPALTLINADNIRGIMKDWHGKRGSMAEAWKAKIYVPDGSLTGITDQEALDFLLDCYGHDADLRGKYVPKTKTAKAFFDWKDGPGEDQEC